MPFTHRCRRVVLATVAAACGLDEPWLPDQTWPATPRPADRRRRPQRGQYGPYGGAVLSNSSSPSDFPEDPG